LGLCGLAQAQTAPLAQAENSFAVDLYKQLRTRPGNLFFSPYSVATGVGMVYVGAKGETAAQIAQVLHLEKLPPSSDPQAAYLADVKAQSASLAHLSERGTMFQAANAIWTSKDLTFQPAFLAKIQNDFGGSVTAVDFGDPIAASDTIDRWVMNETAHHIQNLVTPEMLEPPPGLVLTNAIYFRPVWDDPFLPEATQQEIFHVRPGHDVKTAMMNKTAGYSLDVAPGVKILTLPYHSGVYCQSGQCHTYGTSMLIILPDSATGLPRLEAGLTEAKLEKWLHDSQTAAVILKLPKFSAESDFSLKDELVKLGIKTAFKRFGADLTGIANDPEKRLYVGAVLHKAYISVDEKGAEAAAATAIVGPVAMSAPPPPPLNPPPPVPFFADHPFLYLIRDDNTGTILFMGRVENPTD
jgi:serpin B